MVYYLLMAQAKKTQEKNNKTLKEELLGQMLTLSTSGFGLVAALAWNEAIQSFVKNYIEKYFPLGAVWTKFIYAGLITLLAVMVTYNLSRVAARLGHKRN